MFHPPHFPCIQNCVASWRRKSSHMEQQKRDKHHIYCWKVVAAPRRQNNSGCDFSQKWGKRLEAFLLTLDVSIFFFSPHTQIQFKYLGLLCMKFSVANRSFMSVTWTQSANDSWEIVWQIVGCSLWLVCHPQIASSQYHAHTHTHPHTRVSYTQIFSNLSIFIWPPNIKLLLIWMTMPKGL